MEKTLKTSQIKTKTIFKIDYEGNIYLLFFENGVKAIFKPNRPLVNQASALRAYHFSQLLDLNLVPPTVIRTIDGKRGIVQLFIEGETGDNYDLDRLSAFQKSDIYLFHVILGELDPSTNDIVIGQNCKSPALIDNEGNIEWLSIVQRGDFPYFTDPDRYNPTLEFSDYKKFPFHHAKGILNFSSIKYNLDELKKRMPDIKPETVVFHFKEPIKQALYDDTLYYFKWKNDPWFKINIKAFSYLYKQFAVFDPSKQTTKKFKSLNRKDLYFLSFIIGKSFNKKNNQEIIDVLNSFNDFVLYRRNMILREYETI